MYRKHGNEFVVKVIDVTPLIPVSVELTDEQKSDERLVQFHAEYQAWIVQGNAPLEQAES
jgi:hypothetical protein